MIGLDTGFFVELLRNNSTAVRIWEGIVEGDEAVISCLTAYELKRLSLSGVIDSDAVDTILEAVRAVSKIVWLDKTEVLITAAAISQSHGIHAMNALILASLASMKAKTIYTTDAHLEKYRPRGVSIVLLPRVS